MASQDAELVSAFYGTSQASTFLHIVYGIRIADARAFELWDEFHDEARWLEPREAAQLVTCDEDRRIIARELSRSVGGRRKSC